MWEGQNAVRRGCEMVKRIKVENTVWTGLKTMRDVLKYSAGQGQNPVWEGKENYMPLALAETIDRHMYRVPKKHVLGNHSRNYGMIFIIWTFH